MKNWWTRHVSVDTVILYLFGLLIAGMFVMWAVVGWAKDAVDCIFTSDKCSHPAHIKIDRQSFEALIKQNPKAKLRVLLVPSYCEKEMEAAMRAIEPYVLRTHAQAGDTCLKGDQFCRIDGINSGGDKFGPIRDQWNAVKKECWRQP